MPASRGPSIATNQIIPLKRTETGRRLKRRPAGRKPIGTTAAGQATRLGPRLEATFADVLERDDIDVARTPDAFAPERVLVFETIGDLANFAKTAERVGLEWLAEQAAMLAQVDYLGTDEEEEGEEDDDEPEGDDGVDFAMGDEVEIPTDRPGRFYMGMPTQKTFEELRRLWRLYSTNGARPDGYGDWWVLFAHLHDLRPWSASDRIPEATRLYAERILAENADAEVLVEIDLWYRADRADRAAAMASVKEAVSTASGVVLDEADYEAIRYAAILARIPASSAAAVAAATGDLATSRDVMRIRPQTMARSTLPSDEADVRPRGATVARRVGTKPALAALLDGYPVQDHDLLRNLLDVVEVGVDESMAPLPTRRHGTAMASLIMRGDLQIAGPVPDRTLKVVPILTPRDGGREGHPTQRLVVNTVFDAIEALKDARKGVPSGPDVIICNQSICDEAAPFAGSIGPWARALDHLAYEYKLLFVVSAGNIGDGFPMPGYADVRAFRGADHDGRRRAILLAIDAAKAMRGTLSPAESVNALTVGAAHGDGSTGAVPATVVDPYGAMRLPSLASAMGFGLDGALKPEMLTDGGRLSALPTGSPMHVRAFETPVCFGQEVAAPDLHGAGSTKTLRCSGTSNATALVTRSALLVADALDETFAGAGDLWYKRPTAPCMLKALVAHSSRWRDHGDELDAVLLPRGSAGREKRKRAIARHLGYGLSDWSRILDAAGNRVTLLADDVIVIRESGSRHSYRIPIPQEFGRLDLRRVTLTLAWLTPTRPESVHYRAIALDLVGADGSTKIWPGLKRIAQPSIGLSRKGTLLHAVYEGSGRASALRDDATFELNVQASSRLATGFTLKPVPYALAVTIELAGSVETDIFTPIAQRVRPTVRV